MAEIILDSFFGLQPLLATDSKQKRGRLNSQTPPIKKPLCLFNYSGISHQTGSLQIASFIANGLDFNSCSLL